MERITTNIYKFDYIMDDKPYQIFIKIKKDSEIWSIYDQYDLDITDDILPYFNSSHVFKQ